MADETRRLLKIFGVAVTDFEAEAEKLQAAAAQLSADSGKNQIAKLLRDATELCGELNNRWLETITLAPKKLIRTRRASEGSASEPSLARRVSMCKDAKLSCRGNRGLGGHDFRRLDALKGDITHIDLLRDEGALRTRT